MSLPPSKLSVFARLDQLLADGRILSSIRGPLCVDVHLSVEGEFSMFTHYMTTGTRVPVQVDDR